MLGQSKEFYHGLTKKYVVIFGNLFNNIYISRSDGSNPKEQNWKVPLGFGPREKYLGRLKEDESARRDTAISLPRMSYEVISMNYAPERMVNPIGKIRHQSTTLTSVYNPVPYDIIFQLSIMTKTIEDGLKIVEQIIPHFTPEFTVTAQLIDSMEDHKKDIPIILNNVIGDDSYEGSFTERRVVMWVLDFTMKAWFYSGVQEPKVIKFATTNLYPNSSPTFSYSKVEVFPGLTANGEPTTDPDETINYLEIEEDDNWDYIILKEDIIDDE